MVQKIAVGSCTAMVDVITGTGLLAVRSRHSDVLSPRGDGSFLSDVEVGQALGVLSEMGVEPCLDEFESILFDAELTDGRRVISLFVINPVNTSADLPSIAGSYAVLRDVLSAAR